MSVHRGTWSGSNRPRGARVASLARTPYTPDMALELLELWNEDLLEALEPTEHDFQEFKSSAWMVGKDGQIPSEFTHLLSKQISAFANGAGGRVFIGLHDWGEIDGGVPVDLRKGGTRSWLEDVVPHTVDPPLQRCNVFEVRRSERSAGSRILPHHAIYVIDIPASERAPHQAKDHRYYLRIAGKSRPMGHVHLQDVLRRTRRARVELTRLGPYGRTDLDTTDARGPRALVQLRAFLMNTGGVLARHVGLDLILPRQLAGREVRRRMRANGETHYTQHPGSFRFFRYHPMPIFPSQEVYGASVWLVLHGNNVAAIEQGAALEWIVYADDAEPLRGQRALGAFGVVQEAVRWVRSQ